ncbi:MAG: hypothetical protein AMJ79_15940 [Phycisphaerae bacterium SM23_30]|nr:MAG: hypothetical protein AMJ79_15940 [Phycisphaerae bacterium SM23_30]
MRGGINAGGTPAVLEGGERSVVVTEAGGTPAIHYDGGTGTVWYVDDDGVNDPGPGDPTVSDPLEDGSIGHPFDSIQEAIDAAVSGDMIIVQAGTYKENIYLKGKNITLTSSDQNYSSVIARTVIQGDGMGPVVTFAGSEWVTLRLPRSIDAWSKIIPAGGRAGVCKAARGR